MVAIVPPYLNATEQQTADNLTTALDLGDFATIDQILDRWPSRPEAEHNSGNYEPGLWPFKLVLSGAIEQDNVQLISLVLDAGLKIELYAVLDALDIESIGIFQTFIDHGWDINEPLGETMPPPLSYVSNNEPLCRWFLSHGASPNAAASRLARTPVTEAAAGAPLSIVKILYANGASHHDGLQSAAESSVAGRLEVMQFLLDEGADINAAKWKHHPESYANFGALELGTALHYAAKNGFADRVEMLLKRGARFDVLDSTGKTALDLARGYGQEETTRILSSLLRSEGESIS